MPFFPVENHLSNLNQSKQLESAHFCQFFFMIYHFGSSSVGEYLYLAAQMYTDCAFENTHPEDGGAPAIPSPVDALLVYR